jgi:hypothetical protein
LVLVESCELLVGQECREKSTSMPMFSAQVFKYPPGNHSGVMFDISVKFSIKLDHFPPISNLRFV